MQPWPALKHPTPALPSRCPWALRIMVVPGEDVELGGQWRARHRWTANDLSFATVPLAASSVGFKTLYEAIRKSRIVSAFPGGSPVTEKSVAGQTYLTSFKTGPVSCKTSGALQYRWSIPYERASEKGLEWALVPPLQSLFSSRFTACSSDS